MDDVDVSIKGNGMWYMQLVTGGKAEGFNRGDNEGQTPTGRIDTKERASSPRKHSASTCDRGW
jgi:hypothetical protein